MILKCNQKCLKSFSRKNRKNRARKNRIHYVCTRSIGRVAERLGRGLQNLVQQFESARDLNKNPSFNEVESGVFRFLASSLLKRLKTEKSTTKPRAWERGVSWWSPLDREYCLQDSHSARDLNKNVPVPLRGMGIFVFVTMQVYLPKR